MKANPRPSLKLCLGAGFALALGSCSEPPVRPAAAPPPPPRIAAAVMVAPAPPPVAAADWHTLAFTPGDWLWSAAPPQARYGDAGGPLLTLACNRARATVSLIRHGAGPAPGAMVITTASLARALNAAPQPAGTMMADLPARDPLLDAMAFSRGRFMVEVPGAAPLIVPAWPEVARVVEECR